MMRWCVCINSLITVLRATSSKLNVPVLCFTCIVATPFWNFCFCPFNPIQNRTPASFESYFSQHNPIQKSVTDNYCFWNFWFCPFNPIYYWKLIFDNGSQSNIRPGKSDERKSDLLKCFNGSQSNKYVPSMFFFHWYFVQKCEC